MTRDQVLDEIRSMLGMVPEEYTSMPDDLLEQEWMIDKMVDFREKRIPLKYKQLIGLSAASIVGNRRLAFLHRELAKHFGATDEEIIETLMTARRTAGRSAFLTGAGVEMEKYRDEVKTMINTLRQRKAA